MGPGGRSIRPRAGPPGRGWPRPKEERSVERLAPERLAPERLGPAKGEVGPRGWPRERLAPERLAWRGWHREVGTGRGWHRRGRHRRGRHRRGWPRRGWHCPGRPLALIAAFTASPRFLRRSLVLDLSSQHAVDSQRFWILIVSLVISVSSLLALWFVASRPGIAVKIRALSASDSPLQVSDLWKTISLTSRPDLSAHHFAPVRCPSESHDLRVILTELGRSALPDNLQAPFVIDSRERWSHCLVSLRDRVVNHRRFMCRPKPYANRRSPETAPRRSAR